MIQSGSGKIGSASHFKFPWGIASDIQRIDQVFALRYPSGSGSMLFEWPMRSVEGLSEVSIILEIKSARVPEELIAIYLSCS